MRFFVGLLTIVFFSIRAISAAPPVTAAAISPDGKHVVSGSQTGVAIHSWPELKPVGTLAIDCEHIHDLQFSPTGKELLVAGGSPAEAGIVEIWKWPTREPMKQTTLTEDLIYRAAWSPDGSEFAAVSADGTCRIFNLENSRERICYSGHSRAVLAVAYLPDGKSILSAGVDQTLQLWNATSGDRIRALDNHLAAINDLAIRPSTDKDALPIVASVSDDRTVRLWQPTIGRLVRFARLSSPPRTVEWSADGKQVIVGCNDGSLYSIDAETLTITQSSESFRSGRIHVLQPAADGGWLVGGEGGQLQRVPAFAK